MLGQIFFADARFAIEAVQRGLGGDADEVAIAFFVFGEDQQVVILFALTGRSMILFLADVEFAAENGLDALLLGGVEEVDGSVDVAVIGDGDGGLANVGDAVDQFFYVASS